MGLAPARAHEYSLLDGCELLKDMLRTAARERAVAVEMTDNRQHIRAYRTIWSGDQQGRDQADIGNEAPRRAEHRRTTASGPLGHPTKKDDDVSGAGAYTQLTLLAETTEGLAQSVPAVFKASLEGQFSQARMDREMIAEHATGIIATTGCPSDEVQDPAEARPVPAGAPGGRRITRHLRRGQLSSRMLRRTTALSIERG